MKVKKKKYKFIISTILSQLELHKHNWYEKNITLQNMYSVLLLWSWLRNDVQKCNVPFREPLSIQETRIS